MEFPRQYVTLQIRQFIFQLIARSPKIRNMNRANALDVLGYEGFAPGTKIYDYTVDTKLSQMSKRVRAIILNAVSLPSYRKSLFAVAATRTQVGGGVNCLMGEIHRYFQSLFLTQNRIRIWATV